MPVKPAPKKEETAVKKEEVKPVAAAEVAPAAPKAQTQEFLNAMKASKS